MLVAAAHEIRVRFGGQPVIEVRHGTQRQRVMVGVDTLLSIQKLRFHPSGGRRSLLRPFKDHLPVIFASDIDAVFDVSGFAFGDQWRDANLQRRANHLEWWSKRVPVYLLPQALGPFEYTAQPARTALTAARLAFARDPDSYAFAQEIVDGVQLEQAPDFTALIDAGGPLAADYRELEGGLAIVPNWNIAKRAKDDAERRAYIANLARWGHVAREAGIEPFGLCHEGSGDYALLEAVRGELPGLRIVDGLDGLRSKTVLGRSRLVVAGRFHALVSALSQGVPSISHGWSHKYRWMATDFAADNLVRNPYETGGHSEDIERVLSDEQQIRDAILDGASRVKAEATRMWDQVAADLSGQVGVGAG